MQTNALLTVLRWPAHKGSLLNPWYVILWRLAVLPFTIAFGLGFYLTLVLSGYSGADYFRRDWLSFH